MKAFNIKISKQDQYTIARTIRREAEIAENLRINHKKVHKSKKAYNRKDNKKINWD